MEDEVVRLQEEWSAVLQEIQRASEENLVLKEILMLSISHPTCTEGGSGATTRLPGPTENAQHVEAATINPKDHFLPTADRVETASSTCKDTTTSPNSHVKAPVPMDCSCDGDAETFDFLPNISTSRQENHEYLEAQRRFTEEMDEATFSSFTTLSHGPTDKLNTGHYLELGLSLHGNDFMFHEEERHAYHGAGGHDQVDHRPEHLAYYDLAELSPMAEPPTRTPSSTRAGYFDIEHSYSFKVESDLAKQAYASASLLPCRHEF